MIQKFKLQLLTIVTLAISTLSLAVPTIVTAQAAPTTNPVQKSVCTGAQNLQFNSPEATGCDTQITENTLNTVITSVINILSVVVGVIAVIMIIIGGFRYITSGGDSTKVGSAKNTILYALIGLVIVAISQVIVRFVLSKSTTIGAQG